MNFVVDLPNRNGAYISAMLGPKALIPVPEDLPSCKVDQTHMNKLIKISRNRNEHPGLKQIGGGINAFMS